MKQLVQNLKNGKLTVEDVPAPILKPGGVIVRNHFSLISPGTDKLLIELGQKNIVGKAKARPDLVKKVLDSVKTRGVIETFHQVMGQLDSPMPCGYSCAGVIEEVDDTVMALQVGDRVACAGGGYASHAESVFVPKNLCVSVPDTVDLESASFATLGAIAMQGVRRAELTLGENVAVIGLGLVGQLAAQLVKASGCKVLGIELDSQKAELAKKMGADLAISPSDDAIHAALSFSKGTGVDAVLIAASTTSNGPMELASEICRDRGRIAVIGVVKMEVPRRPFYEKELDLRLSRSYGPGRYDPNYEEKGVDYPIGYVRWTEQRNMVEFLSLIAQKKIDVKPLITHRFDFDNALTAYDLVMGKTKEPFLGILLKYDPDKPLERKIDLKGLGKRFTKSPKRQVSVGMIGAGNFAKNVIMPRLSKIGDVKLRAVATASGLTARNSGEKYDCDYVTSDYTELINDEEINAIIVATRHDLHARIVIEALKNAKDVFVEKPLAVSMEELEEVKMVFDQANQRLMVGFNRRFSPFARRSKTLFAGRTNPICITYRVNAGFIPKENWIHEHGGRIVGEICHFVDLMLFLTDAPPSLVYAIKIPNTDNVIINLNFSDGSMGSIHYLDNGDKSFSKERIEIFGDGKIAVIDDFRRCELISNGNKRKIKITQDKGHRAELEAFIKSIQSGNEVPIPFNQLYATTLTTFKIIESIYRGSPMKI